VIVRIGLKRAYAYRWEIPKWGSTISEALLRIQLLCIVGVRENKKYMYIYYMAECILY